jgi:nitrite reductase (NO-forming)
MLEAWDVSKPAHAWLNVFGFLSLVIGATLIHLLPTVAGTRIERTRLSTLALGGLMVGPMVTAAGFLVRGDALVAAGSLVELAGAVALLGYAAQVVRRRGRWTTDPAWHRMSLVSLTCAVGWFVVAAGLATVTAWSGGATARGWDGSLLLGPLAIGWAAQALVGSWTHLVPSIGPGSPLIHARQRRVLGTLALPRIVALQTGVVLLSVAVPAGNGSGVGLALVLTAGSLGVSVALLIIAASQLRRGPPSAARSANA